MKQEILRLESVTFKKANRFVFRNLSLNIMAGEIMGLFTWDIYDMDELIRIIVENPELYYGYVYYQERCVNSWKGVRHGKNRIAVIESETSLVNGLSIATNIFVLRTGFRKEIINDRLLAGQLEPFLKELNLSLDPLKPVDVLTPYERVMVELLRAVVTGCRLIIMREMETVLGENEVRELYRTMRFYTEKGFTFLYISYHFEELQQICTRAVHMTNFGIELIFDEAQVRAGLDKNMYRDFYNRVSDRARHYVRKTGPEVMEARDITGEYLNHFSFRVYRGECLVIQCLDTQFYSELTEILGGEGGLEKTEIYLKGERLRNYQSRQVAFIKEEASESMIFEYLSVRDNLCLGLDGRFPQIWFRKKYYRSVEEEYRRIFGEDISGRSVGELTEAERLKLVYMRIMLEKPDVVFMAQPFKHSEYSQRQQSWALQAMLLERGISIVILAVNMADSLTIADRVIRLGRTGFREFGPDEFGHLPMYLPWVEMFDQIEEEPRQFRMKDKKDIQAEKTSQAPFLRKRGSYGNNRR